MRTILFLFLLLLVSCTGTDYSNIYATPKEEQSEFDPETASTRVTKDTFIYKIDVNEEEKLRITPGKYIVEVNHTELTVSIYRSGDTVNVYNELLIVSPIVEMNTQELSSQSIVAVPNKTNEYLDKTQYKLTFVKNIKSEELVAVVQRYHQYDEKRIFTNSYDLLKICYYE